MLNAVCKLAILPLLIWAAIYGIMALALGKTDASYDMDPARKVGAFLPLYDRYCLPMRWITILSSIALLLSVWFQAQLKVLAFGGAVVYSIVFQLVTMFFYERYLHKTVMQAELPWAKGKIRPYATEFYAATLALGVSTLLAFIAGIALLIGE